MVLAKAGQKMKETFVFSLILNQFSSSQLLTDKNVKLLIAKKRKASLIDDETNGEKFIFCSGFHPLCIQ